MDISIGKFTLESLTTGMYNEPESCYREYIQNAVDSIDIAVESGIIKKDESRIEIVIDNSNSIISIKDNGGGISVSAAAKTLLDIGNSTKLHSTNRGFRGIGRLGGLSYCKKLSFCTTAVSEDVKTIVSFDCIKLKELLVPGKEMQHDLSSVINAVTTVTVLPEQATAHYFIVKMEGVDDIVSLLDIDIVRDYLSQVAPVPFKDRFFWSREIKNQFQNKGINIDEYALFIGSSFEDLSQIYKPYVLTLNVSAKADAIKDSIHDISYCEIIDNTDNLLAYGWYANTEFSGTLTDDRISGIRIRQGNILIGSSRTLAPLFKEARFNAWSMGEIYIVSPDLIPNARRDDFERNAAFMLFENGVKNTLGTEISDKIRAASKARNNPAQKVITKTEKTITRIEQILESGFNSSFEKDQVSQDLAKAKKDVQSISKTQKEDVVKQKEDLIAKISELTESVDESSNFKAKKDITSNFSKDQKRIIQAVLEVLTRNFERGIVDSLYQEILKELGKR